MDTHDGAAAGEGGRIGTRSAPEFKGLGRRQVARPYFFLALHAYRPLMGGARWSLIDTDEIVVGRGSPRGGARAGNPRHQRLTITVDCPFLSTEHARFVRAGSDWSIADIRSKNGVYVNGERVQPGTTIAHGDVITMGQCFFMLDEHAAEQHGDLDAEDVTAIPRGLLTLHPTYAESLALLRRAAPTKSPVTLVGETGTGKEIVARAIHELSGRRGPYFGISCAEIARSLIASELFGYVKGAFTGALRDHPGHIRGAEGGTLMLDEILSAPMELQVALLRAMQEQKVMPLGGRAPVAFDVRFIAATQQPLDEAISKHGFRGDLHARLLEVVCRLLPLRERLCDMGNLVALTLRDNGAPPDTTLTLDAALALLLYHWPLNIRELASSLIRAKTLASGTAIDATHLPQPATIGTEDQLKKDLIAELRNSKGNVSEVARRLNRNRTLVHKWMRNLGIEARSFR